MLIDKLKLHYEIGEEEDDFIGRDRKVRNFTLTTFINDEKFLPSLVLNLYDLENLLIEDKEYWNLFTCTCGDAGCGGVQEAPSVAYLNDNIIIRIKSPIKRTLVLTRDNIIEEIDTLRNKLFRERDIKEYRNIEIFACEPIYDWLMS
jgi:hypothetical protein